MDIPEQAKESLIKLNKNLNILRERQAKYGGNAPLELLNQIDDHEQAIVLTEQAIAGKISEGEWRQALQPLLLAIRDGQVVNIDADTYIAGDVKGDVISGDQIITHIYEAPPPPLSPAEAKERRELGILLNKVKQFWIEGVLEKSVHNIALIDLGKETQAEAVAHAWEQVLELPDQSRQTLPPDKKISHIFDEMNRALLILGAPGSGKTITLLQLARDLISQAEQDESFSQPIPAVFPLASWTKDQALIDWIVAELSAQYQIPKRIGRPWLESHRLLPLLDGLDEVKDDDQAACVAAINHFGQEFGLSGLVVCCRTEEYIRLPVRLKLNGAVRLLPLTLEQVYDYLDAAGAKLNALREALQKDDSLQELAKSPLILGVMSLAYQDIPAKTLASQSFDTAAARRKHLFDTYIARMFRRKGIGTKPYADEYIRHCLAWLAQKMSQYNQTIFLIENIQPDWLSSRSWFWVYLLVSRAIFGWTGGLTIAIATWLAGDSPYFIFDVNPLVTGLPNLFIYWTSFGLVAGLVLGLVDGLRAKKRGNNVETKSSRPGLWSLVTSILAYGLAVGLVLGLGFGLTLGPLVGLLQGFMFGFVLGLFFGFRGMQHGLTYRIQTVEALRWSWSKAIKFIPFGLMGGFIFGLGLLFLGLIIGLDEGLIFRITGGTIFGLNAVWTAGLISATICGLIGGLMIAAFGGLQSSILETKTRPNQGIRLSIRNALFAGLGFGLIFGLSIGILLTLLNGPFVGLAFGITYTLSVGVLAALWYGGLEVIQHFVLSIILWYRGHIPRQYTRLLDSATDCVFLQKVGGGYIFVHRLLLEHFSRMYE